MESGGGNDGRFDSQFVASVLVACMGLMLVIVSIDRAIDACFMGMRVVHYVGLTGVYPWSAHLDLGTDVSERMKAARMREAVDFASFVTSTVLVLVLGAIGLRLLVHRGRLRALFESSLERTLRGEP